MERARLGGGGGKGYNRLIRHSKNMSCEFQTAWWLVWATAHSRGHELEFVHWRTYLLDRCSTFLNWNIKSITEGDLSV